MDGLLSDGVRANASAGKRAMHGVKLLPGKSLFRD
jgi:hypothetical protein